MTRDVIGRYLDALLSELPEEAVEAGVRGFLNGDIDAANRRDNVRDAVHAFLRSLRSSSRGPADGE